MSAQPAPIIIKRKKIIAAGHHGGAWKVAYADFVTAMMAFFLLMWLLGATNEKQRKGIADYFNPTIPVNKVSGGGAGAFGGESIFTEETLAANGSGTGTAVLSSESEASADEDDTKAAAKAAEAKVLDEITKKLAGISGESMNSELLRRHVVTRLTDEGLIVEVFDIPGEPLFEGESDPTAVLQDAVFAVAEVFNLANNGIAVQGHTAAVPLVVRMNPVWERSAARADRVRQMLVSAGLEGRRMSRVSGFADRIPVAENTLAARNNRIEIILLRNKF